MVREDVLMTQIKAVIQAEVEKAMEQVIEKAKQDLESRLRAQLAPLTLSILKFYSVERMGETIVIRVENRR